MSKIEAGRGYIFDHSQVVKTENTGFLAKIRNRNITVRNALAMVGLVAAVGGMAAVNESSAEDISQKYTEVGTTVPLEEDVMYEAQLKTPTLTTILK